MSAGVPAGAGEMTVIGQAAQAGLGTELLPDEVVDFLARERPGAKTGVGVDVADVAQVDEAATPGARPVAGPGQRHPGVGFAADDGERQAQGLMGQVRFDAELGWIGRGDHERRNDAPVSGADTGGSLRHALVQVVGQGQGAETVGHRDPLGVGAVA